MMDVSSNATKSQNNDHRNMEDFANRYKISARKSNSKIVELSKSSNFITPNKLSGEQHNVRPQNKQANSDNIASGNSSNSGVSTDITKNNVIKLAAKFICSFSVEGSTQVERAEYVRKRLALMREVNKSKDVLLMISLSGIKVCSSNGETVFMAHALKRISYATCDPDYCQFSFLAREPKGTTNVQYCHAFQTATSEEADTLNTAVGNSFQMAYSLQRQQQIKQNNQQVSSPPAEQFITSPPKNKETSHAHDESQGHNETESRPASTVVENGSRPNSEPPDTEIQQSEGPSFNELIEKQIQEQKQQYAMEGIQKQKSLEEKLSVIATPNINERVRDRRERRKKEEEQQAKETEKMLLAGKERTSWAKHIVNRARHKLPYLDDALGSSSNNVSGSPPHSTSTAAMGTLQSSPAAQQMSTPQSTPTHHQSTSHHAAAMATYDTPPNSHVGRSPQHHSAVTAIREAMDANGHRSHGSPVMTLKESIDNHFMSQRKFHALSARPPSTVGGATSSKPVRSQDSTDGANDESLINGASPNCDDRPISTLSSPNIHQSQSTSADGIKTPQSSSSSKQSDPSQLPPSCSPSATDGESIIHDLKSNHSAYKLSPKERSTIRTTPTTTIMTSNTTPAGGSSYQPPPLIPRPRSIAEVPNRSTSNTNSLLQNHHHTNGFDRPSSVACSGDTTNSAMPFTGGLGDLQTGDTYVGPPTPQRFDSLRQFDSNGVPYTIENEEQLKQQSWYQPGIPREISLEILSRQEIGSFVIRDSSSHPGCYALSVKVPKYDNPNGISNYLIVPTESGGVRLKGLDKEWPSMAALVTHHTVMKEMLPCTLTLPRNAANPAFNETEQNDRDEDDDYQKLASCRAMMNDMRI